MYLYYRCRSNSKPGDNNPAQYEEVDLTSNVPTTPSTVPPPVSPRPPSTVLPRAKPPRPPQIDHPLTQSSKCTPCPAYVPAALSGQSSGVKGDDDTKFQESDEYI